MIDFRFPELLYFYFPIGLIWLLWRLRSSKADRLFPAAPESLENNLFNRLDQRRRSWRQRFGILGLVFLLFSASGPKMGTRLKPVERKGIDLVFALDVSVSMDAEDVKPSRLEKAKFEISQMIKQLTGDRVGLIVFAGSSNLYLPLTSDYEAALMFLDAVDTQMIPTQGTDLSTALNTTINTFPSESDKFKVLTLVTDGEDHQGEAIKVAADAAKTGIVINAVGVGTTTGSLIPVRGGKDQLNEYKRDSRGRLITSILNERILQEIAHAGDGIYVRFDNRFANYREILAEINSMEKRTINTHEYSQFEDRYQIFSLFALVFLIVAFVMPTRHKREETWRGRIV